MMRRCLDRTEDPDSQGVFGMALPVPLEEGGVSFCQYGTLLKIMYVVF